MIRLNVFIQPAAGNREAVLEAAKALTACSLADRGIRVIAAGLDMDYLGNPFGPMPALMAEAEYVTKVHAICVRCGNLAHHSHRLTRNDRLVMLGEKDTYEPVCRHCFAELRAQEISEREHREREPEAEK